jgi:transcriptional regulator NrdR family protein
MAKFRLGGRAPANRALPIERERICQDCVHRFGFLAELTEDERILARDKYHREQAAAERVRTTLR